MNLPDEPLIRVMALHALAYCERLFYLEEVEEIRVADAAVFAGRALHEELGAGDADVVDHRTFELASESLGLIGKADAVRRRDGLWVAYEHKRGRPHRRKGQPPLAWPSDHLQVSAYGMLIEEATGERVDEGRVRYHAENVTVRVPLDEVARNAVYQAVARARELRIHLERPPVPDNDRLCLHCSLAPVCLPEEERLAEDSDWKPVRLFPPDRERQIVHVTDHSARVKRSGETLVVEVGEEVRYRLPAREVESVILHGYPQVTTQALHFCASNDIAVHWLSGGGRYVAGLSVGPGQVQRRLRQYQALSDQTTCLVLARRLAQAKVEGQLRYLLRLTRGAERTDPVQSAIDEIRGAIKVIVRAENVNSVRGGEGLAGRAYFSALPSLLKERVPSTFVPQGRNRRPPLDRFNALLGFGYALLYQAVLNAILAVGLEPALGFFHTPRSSAHPLVMDLMELFRVPVWDIAMIGSVNRLQWDPTDDFVVTKQKVWLSDNGRKKAIALFEKRLEETWRHPVTDYSLNYWRMIELEVRLLEKEWSGEPGLFARARLR